MTDDERLEQVFRETFPEGGHAAEMTYQRTPGWDSMRHMVLCSRIEEAFDVMLEIQDISDLSSLAAAREILKRRRG